jgi:hypothetical protein
MNAADDAFAGARIKPDGDTLTWNDSRVGVARIEISDHAYWFIPEHKWHENGNDFWIVIRRFGFTLRDAAGTKTGTGRAIFTKKLAESAKKRLIEYYSGSEDKIVFPFGVAKTKFLGVIFEDGWILVRN